MRGKTLGCYEFLQSLDMKHIWRLYHTFSSPRSIFVFINHVQYNQAFVKHVRVFEWFFHSSVSVNVPPVWTSLEDTWGGRKKILDGKFFDGWLELPRFLSLVHLKKTSLTSSVPVLLCLFWTSTSLTILRDTVKTISFTEPLNVHFLSRSAVWTCTEICSNCVVWHQFLFPGIFFFHLK